MRTTPNWAIPFPEPGDSTRTWEYWQAMAERIDTMLAAADAASAGKFLRSDGAGAVAWSPVSSALTHPVVNDTLIADTFAYYGGPKNVVIPPGRPLSFIAVCAFDAVNVGAGNYTFLGLLRIDGADVAGLAKFVGPPTSGGSIIGQWAGTLAPGAHDFQLMVRSDGFGAYRIYSASLNIMVSG